MQFLIVFAGGGIGSVLRYLIGIGFQKSTIPLPLATFIANLSACLIFALVVWLSETKIELSYNMRLLLLTGFCGGLSTFSTFGYETFLLLKQGMFLYGILNILFSTAFCVTMFYLLDR